MLISDCCLGYPPRLLGDFKDLLVGRLSMEKLVTCQKVLLALARDCDRVRVNAQSAIRVRPITACRLFVPKAYESFLSEKRLLAPDATKYCSIVQIPQIMDMQE